MNEFSLLESKLLFDGRVVRLYLDKVLMPDGREAWWETVRHWGAVGIIPIDDDGCIYFVRQYRHAPGEDILEIPAGKLSPREDPRLCAERELEEEVGLKAREWRFLCSFYTSPGFSDEIVYLYLARELYPGKLNPDQDEYLETSLLRAEDAMEMIWRGEIKDSKTIIGVLMAWQVIQERRLPE